MSVNREAALALWNAIVEHGSICLCAHRNDAESKTFDDIQQSCNKLSETFRKATGYYARPVPGKDTANLADYVWELE